MTEPTHKDDRPRERRPRSFATIFAILACAGLILYAVGGGGSSGRKVDWFEFRAALKTGPEAFEKLALIRGEWAFEGTWGAKGPNPGESFRVEIPNQETFLTPEFLEQEVKPVVGRLPIRDPSRVWDYVLSFLPWLVLLAVFWFFFFRQMRANSGPANVLSFGRSRAKMQTKEHVNVSFEDVAGVEEAKDEVQEIVAFLKNPSRFQRLGGRVPKGVLLVGPPGTGKTLLAKAIAGEADVPFYSISGSDFVEMFVGVGASRVRDLFKQARENSPCIIFLDEIDAVGRRRGAGLGGGHDEREQTLNAILVEMDGFDTDTGIIIIAATNRPDILDPALLRPGRFDRQIVVEMPDLRGREGILKVHARGIRLAPDADLKVLARGTPGFSGADLEALMNEGAILATMKEKDHVEMDDLEEARDKVKWGRQKRSRVVELEDRRITALHEAGHALVAHYLPEAEPLHKVTIIPRGMALGATMQLPERDRYHISRRRLTAMMTMLFAGRAAEELFCDDVTSGAQNDIERATEIARRMVTEWGLSERIGPIHFREGQQTLFLGHEVTRSKDHSEKTAQEIDDEVRRILMETYARARQILEEHRAETEALAEALLRYESLNAEEVAAVLRGETVETARRAAEAKNVAAPPAAKADGPAAPKKAGGDPEPEGGFAY
ncbi:MAG: ATP-dependent zinc metalloprotease FtsH [Planctomycetes bacterium]|jgi:cell division protease FtsH|nr:ATP-dependent zinc metalloprotease FtsH [Planctomycetota bacterium]